MSTQWSIRDSEPFALDDEGYLEIPDTPGLGVEVDTEKIKRLTVS